MKNLYPIFLLALLILTLVNPLRSSPDTFSPEPQWESYPEILLIQNATALYENQADTVQSFIQELAQRYGSRLRVWDPGQNGAEYIAFSSYRLIIAVGEESLLKLSPQVQEQLSSYMLGVQEEKKGAFLGLFFQEDQSLDQQRWPWYSNLKNELLRNRKEKVKAPLQFSARLQDVSYSSRPMVFKHTFPLLIPETRSEGNRLILSYMAGRQDAFAHKKRGILRNQLFQRHIEESCSWLLGERSIPPEEGELLSLTLNSFSNYVWFNWRDWTYSADSEYLIQKSDDAINWEIIHTRPATDDQTETSSYEYLNTHIESGDYVFRIIRRERNHPDTYSKSVFLSVSSATPTLKLFPNPARDVLWVHVDQDEMRPTSISIRNSFLSAPIWQSRAPEETLNLKIPVSISSLRPGLYHVCVKTHDARVWKTFVKY